MRIKHVVTVSIVLPNNVSASVDHAAQTVKFTAESMDSVERAIALLSATATELIAQTTVGKTSGS